MRKYGYLIKINTIFKTLYIIVYNNKQKLIGSSDNLIDMIKFTDRNKCNHYLKTLVEPILFNDLAKFRICFSSDILNTEKQSKHSM